MKIENYNIYMNSNRFSYQHNPAKTSLELQEDSSHLTKNVKEIKSDKQKLNKYELELENKSAKELINKINEHKRKLENNRNGIQVRTIRHMELEGVNFQTKAFIKAEDKEFAIDIDVSLQRSFVNLIKFDPSSLLQNDPLVISLDGSMPKLSEKTFGFDIDSDGNEEQISMLGLNSAFLALDLNENGKIDEANELFGAKNGDGFEHLAEFDEDKNGFIDENDSIFHKLRIWKKNEFEDRLIGIGEAGIGAIFLGNVNTQFQYKTQKSNESLGTLQKSGFLLYENGNAGIISHVDLSIKKEVMEKIKKVKSPMIQEQQITKEQKLKTKDESVTEMLQKRIEALYKKLSMAKDDEERKVIYEQILEINARLMSLMSWM